MEHTTPSEEIFNDMKKAATEIWNTYDNTYGYRTEKLDRINSIQNYADNVMVMYRMFDSSNQAKMRVLVSAETTEYINQNL